MIKNSAEIFRDNQKFVEWIKNNGEWLENIKHGSFQYFPITNDFANGIGGGGILMLVYECSFGKFFFGPIQGEKNSKEGEIAPEFDWKQVNTILFNVNLHILIN